MVYLESCQTSMMEFLCLPVKPVNYFCEKIPSEMFGKALNTFLRSTCAHLFENRSFSFITARLMQLKAK